MSLLKGVFAAALISTTLANTSFAMDPADLPSGDTKKPAIIFTRTTFETIAGEVITPSSAVKNTRGLMAGILAGAGGPSSLLADLELIKDSSVSVVIPDFDPTATPKHNQVLDGASELRSSITKAVATVNDRHVTAAASHADTVLLSKDFKTKFSN